MVLDAARYVDRGVVEHDPAAPAAPSVLREGREACKNGGEERRRRGEGVGGGGGDRRTGDPPAAPAATRKQPSTRIRIVMARA